MDVTTMLDLENDVLCRLCLSNDGEMVYIFDPKGYNGYLVWEIIKELLQLEVSREDGLPGTVCLKCLKKVTEFKNFKTICIQSKITILTEIACRGIVENRSLRKPSTPDPAPKNKDAFPSIPVTAPEVSGADDKPEVVDVIEDDVANDGQVKRAEKTAHRGKRSNSRKKGNRRDKDGHASDSPLPGTSGHQKEAAKVPSCVDLDEPEVVEIIEDDSAEEVAAAETSNHLKEVNRNRLNKDGPSSGESSTANHARKDKEPSSAKRSRRDENRPAVVEPLKESKASKEGNASKTSSHRKEKTKDRQKKDIQSSPVTPVIGQGPREKDSSLSKTSARDRTEKGEKAVDDACNNGDAVDKSQKDQALTKPSKDLKEGSKKRPNKGTSRGRQPKVSRRGEPLPAVSDEKKSLPSTSGSDRLANVEKSVDVSKEKNNSHSAKMSPSASGSKGTSRGRQPKVSRRDEPAPAVSNEPKSLPSTSGSDRVTNVEKSVDVSKEKKNSHSAKMSPSASGSKAADSVRNSGHDKDSHMTVENSAEANSMTRTDDCVEESGRTKGRGRGQKRGYKTNKSASKRRRTSQNWDGSEPSTSNDPGALNFIEVPIASDIINVDLEDNAGALADPLAPIKVEKEDAVPSVLPSQQSMTPVSRTVSNSAFMILGSVKQERVNPPMDAVLKGGPSGGLTTPAISQPVLASTVVRPEVEKVTVCTKEDDMDFEEVKYSCTFKDTAPEQQIDGNPLQLVGGEESMNFIAIASQNSAQCGTTCEEVEEDPFADASESGNRLGEPLMDLSVPVFEVVQQLPGNVVTGVATASNSKITSRHNVDYVPPLAGKITPRSSVNELESGQSSVDLVSGIESRTGVSLVSEQTCEMSAVNACSSASASRHHVDHVPPLVSKKTLSSSVKEPEFGQSSVDIVGEIGSQAGVSVVPEQTSAPTSVNDVVCRQRSSVNSDGRVSPVLPPVTVHDSADAAAASEPAGPGRQSDRGEAAEAIQNDVPQSMNSGNSKDAASVRAKSLELSLGRKMPFVVLERLNEALVKKSMGCSQEGRRKQSLDNLRVDLEAELVELSSSPSSPDNSVADDGADSDWSTLAQASPEEDFMRTGNEPADQSVKEKPCPSEVAEPTPSGSSTRHERTKVRKKRTTRDTSNSSSESEEWVPSGGSDLESSDTNSEHSDWEDSRNSRSVKAGRKKSSNQSVANKARRRPTLSATIYPTVAHKVGESSSGLREVDAIQGGMSMLATSNAGNVDGTVAGGLGVDAQGRRDDGGSAGSSNSAPKGPLITRIQRLMSGAYVVSVNHATGGLDSRPLERSVRNESTDAAVTSILPKNGSGSHDPSLNIKITSGQNSEKSEKLNIHQNTSVLGSQLLSTKQNPKHLDDTGGTQQKPQLGTTHSSQLGDSPDVHSHDGARGTTVEGVNLPDLARKMTKSPSSIDFVSSKGDVCKDSSCEKSLLSVDSANLTTPGKVVKTTAPHEPCSGKDVGMVRNEQLQSVASNDLRLSTLACASLSGKSCDPQSSIAQKPELAITPKDSLEEVLGAIFGEDPIILDKAQGVDKVNDKAVLSESPGGDQLTISPVSVVDKPAELPKTVATNVIPGPSCPCDESTCALDLSKKKVADVGVGSVMPATNTSLDHCRVLAIPRDEGSSGHVGEKVISSSSDHQYACSPLLEFHKSVDDLTNRNSASSIQKTVSPSTDKRVSSVIHFVSTGATAGSATSLNPIKNTSGVDVLVKLTCSADRKVNIPLVPSLAKASQAAVCGVLDGGPSGVPGMKEKGDEVCRVAQKVVVSNSGAVANLRANPISVHRALNPSSNHSRLLLLQHPANAMSPMVKESANISSNPISNLSGPKKVLFLSSAQLPQGLNASLLKSGPRMATSSGAASKNVLTSLPEIFALPQGSNIAVPKSSPNMVTSIGGASKNILTSSPAPLTLPQGLNAAVPKSGPSMVTSSSGASKSVLTSLPAPLTLPQGSNTVMPKSGPSTGPNSWGAASNMTGASTLDMKNATFTAVVKNHPNKVITIKHHLKGGDSTHWSTVQSSQVVPQKVAGSQLVQSVSLTDVDMDQTDRNIKLKCTWCCNNVTSLPELLSHLNNRHHEEVARLEKQSKENQGGIGNAVSSIVKPGGTSLGKEERTVISNREEPKKYPPNRHHEEVARLEKQSKENQGGIGNAVSSIVKPGGTSLGKEERTVISNREEPKKYPHFPEFGEFKCRYCPEVFHFKHLLKDHKMVFHSSRSKARRHRGDQDKDSARGESSQSQTETEPKFYVSPRAVFMNSSVSQNSGRPNALTNLGQRVVPAGLVPDVREGDPGKVSNPGLVKKDNDAAANRQMCTNVGPAKLSIVAPPSSSSSASGAREGDPGKVSKSGLAEKDEDAAANKQMCTDVRPAKSLIVAPPSSSSSASGAREGDPGKVSKSGLAEKDKDATADEQMCPNVEPNKSLIVAPPSSSSSASGVREGDAGKVSKSGLAEKDKDAAANEQMCPNVEPAKSSTVAPSSSSSSTSGVREGDPGKVSKSGLAEKDKDAAAAERICPNVEPAKSSTVAPSISSSSASTESSSASGAHPETSSKELLSKFLVSEVQMIKCPKCPVSCRNIVETSVHLMDVHKVPREDIQIEVRDEVSIDKEKSEKSVSKQEEVAKKDPKECKMCTLKFDSYVEYKRHFGKVHMPEVYEMQKQKQIDKLYKGIGVSDQPSPQNK